MKKLMSILLVLAMVLTLAPMAFASEEAVVEAEEIIIDELEEEEPFEQSDEAPALDGAVSGQCGASVSWSLDGGTLTISGAGSMEDFDGGYVLISGGEQYKSYQPWISYADQITGVVVRSGVTSIGDNAFANLYRLKSVELPASVKAIGDHAFHNCDSLTTIKLPEGVETLGTYAFKNCRYLESVTLPVSLKTVAAYAFDSCSALTDVYFSGSEAQWNSISIQSNGNGRLLDAHRTYLGETFIDKVTIKVQPPVAGQRAGDVIASAADTSYGVYKTLWRDMTDNCYLEDDDVFLVGHTYCVYVSVASAAGNVFAYTGSGMDMKLAVTATVNGESAYIGTTVQAPDGQSIEPHYAKTYLTTGYPTAPGGVTINGSVIYYGDTVKCSLTGAATRIPASKLHYQWQTSQDNRNWTDASGGTGSSWTIPSGGASAGYIRVIVTADGYGGQLVSEVHTLNVSAAPIAPTRPWRRTGRARRPQAVSPASTPAWRLSSTTAACRVYT